MAENKTPEKDQALSGKQFHRHLTISLEYGEDSAQDSALLQWLHFLKTILLIRITFHKG